MRRKDKPVRLERKEEFNLELSASLIMTIILVIIILTIAIAMAIGCTSPYNMVWAWGDNMSEETIQEIEELCNLIMDKDSPLKEMKSLYE